MRISSKLKMSLMVLLVAFLAHSVHAQGQSGATGGKPTNSKSAISTLYANDPIAHSLCLTDGKEGGVFQDGEPRNRCSHIEFDAYKAGSLSVGVEGGEVGRIIDLGTEDELSKQYGYQQTVGKGQAFASIEFRDGKLLIMKDRQASTRQDLIQGTLLFEDGTSTASAEAKPGHVYLARITDRNHKEFQILVKLLVLIARPGELVTFRWELL